MMPGKIHFGFIDVKMILTSFEIRKQLRATFPADCMRRKKYSYTHGIYTFKV